MFGSTSIGTEGLREYFREALSGALEAERVRPDAATIAYLIELLCEFSQMPETDLLDQPVALLVANALQKAPAQSVPLLQHVGDHTLYVSGVFGERLHRFRLDRGYYLLVGGAAYTRLSAILGLTSTHAKFVVAFEELGHEFPRFADVLAHIRNSAPLPIRRSH